MFVSRHSANIEVGVLIHRLSPRGTARRLVVQTQLDDKLLRFYRSVHRSLGSASTHQISVALGRFEQALQEAQLKDAVGGGAVVVK